MAGVLQRIQKGFGSFLARWRRSASGSVSVGGGEREWAFAEEVMREHHFTPGAQVWLHANVNLRVDDMGSTRGGGYWMPSTREVRLFTAQHEAAVHELSHAWWHDRRHGHE